MEVEELLLNRHALQTKTTGVVYKFLDVVSIVILEVSRINIIYTSRTTLTVFICCDFLS